MRRSLALVSLLFLCALALAPSSGALPLPREAAGAGSALELLGGRGTAIVSSRNGALIATVRRGRIVVLDRRPGATTTVRFWGCEQRRRPTARKRVCIGRGLRVSVLRGSWQTTLVGRGVNASAVVEGRLTLRGTRGRFVIDRSARRWPRVFRSYALG